MKKTIKLGKKSIAVFSAVLLAIVLTISGYFLIRDVSAPQQQITFQPFNEHSEIYCIGDR